MAAKVQRCRTRILTCRCSTKLFPIRRDRSSCSQLLILKSLQCGALLSLEDSRRSANRGIGSMRWPSVPSFRINDSRSSSAHQPQSGLRLGQAMQQLSPIRLWVCRALRSDLPRVRRDGSGTRIPNLWQGVRLLVGRHNLPCPLGQR